MHCTTLEALFARPADPQPPGLAGALGRQIHPPAGPGAAARGRKIPEVGASLRQRDHDVLVVDAWDDVVGHAQVIGLDGGGMAGASDPRADGAAIGW